MVLLLKQYQTVDTPDIDRWCDSQCDTITLFDAMQLLFHVTISKQIL